MAKRIVITSGKGGAGKTTVTANLGAKLSLEGNRVVMLDIDFGLNNLDVVMGVENKVVYDIVDVVEGRCRAKQALIQDKEYKNLYILPSSHTYKNSSITGQSIKIVVESLSESFDYILLDCPAGIDIGFHRAVSASDEAIVVVTPHMSSIRDADKVISVLKSYKLKNTQVVINRARGDLIISGDMMSHEDILNILKTPLIGVIPEEDEVFLHASFGKAVIDCNSDKAFRMLAENIINGTNFLFDCTKKYSGFWGCIKRNLKKTV